MQPIKKQLEILLLNYFRNSCADFPKGKVEPYESPDFLVKMKSKNILGIELTRLNPQNASEPDEERLNEIRLRENIIWQARGLYERYTDKKLFVKFLFSENNKVSRERELAFAVQLSRLIRALASTKKGFFRENIKKNVLPEGIDEVLVVHHPKLEYQVWERSNNLGVSNDVVDDIRHAIHKKDEKLKLYRKQHLNYYWLLITTDRLRGVKSFNLPEKIMNHHFYSGFQHVFLFDLIKAKVYQLV